jgi:hypothetical protein
MRSCQACGEDFQPEGSELLCSPCNAQIDEQTEELLEQLFFDTGGPDLIIDE